MASKRYKICVVTAARSEYGLLRWVIDGLEHDSHCELQLVVTGAHLSSEYGCTYREIEKDGYRIARMVDMQLASESTGTIVRSMGRCTVGMADAFEILRPDLVVVLGDRYELLSICSAALVMGIPIAHISGGDVTEGAIDNEIRNAVTMMASLHFPGVKDSAENICRMRGDGQNVYVVGEPGLDNFRRLVLWDRAKLAEELALPLDTNWVMMSLHPETQQPLDYNVKMVERILEALSSTEHITVVMTRANADFGGMQINACLESVALNRPDKFLLFHSLGQLRYLSLMKECRCLIGNSSSGIVEAPYFGIPVVNVGGRQKGRHLCDNVISIDNNSAAIQDALQRVLTTTLKDRTPDMYYGDGRTAERIVEQVKRFLADAERER